jgi:hypothetical protein
MKEEWLYIVAPTEDEDTRTDYIKIHGILNGQKLPDYQN